MRKFFVSFLGAAMLLSSHLAFAEEVSGQVTSLDLETFIIRLDDGKDYQVTDDFQLEGIEIGSDVTIDYELDGETRYINDIVISQ